jgi:hypothetical protein
MGIEPFFMTHQAKGLEEITSHGAGHMELGGEGRTHFKCAA